MGMAMLFYCPICEYVVEIVGASPALSFECRVCAVALEPCDDALPAATAESAEIPA
jgi:hypothetical protein